MGDDPNQCGSSRRWLTRAVEDSLRRLQTDYIDLYQVHRPAPDTDVEETLSVLTDLLRQGKVRAIGASTFPAADIVEAQWVARTHNFTQFSSCQDFYNLLYRDIEKRMTPMCIKYGLAMIPYFPLAGAMLSGAYQRNVAPEQLRWGAAGFGILFDDLVAAFCTLLVIALWRFAFA